MIEAHTTEEQGVCRIRTLRDGNEQNVLEAGQPAKLPGYLVLLDGTNKRRQSNSSYPSDAAWASCRQIFNRLDDRLAGFGSASIGSSRENGTTIAYQISTGIH
jgi:hypothetical protein